MKTEAPQELAQPYSRTFTLQDIEQHMAHARQLRSDALAKMASSSTVQTKDLMEAVRNFWTAGVGLGDRFHRA